MLCLCNEPWPMRSGQGVTIHGDCFVLSNLYSVHMVVRGAYCMRDTSQHGAWGHGLVGFSLCGKLGSLCPAILCHRFLPKCTPGPWSWLQHRVCQQLAAVVLSAIGLCYARTTKTFVLFAATVFPMTHESCRSR